MSPPLRLCAVLIVAVSMRQGSAQDTTAKWITEVLEIHPGSTVCEIGAGDGALSLEIAKVVGETGQVFATELGDSRVQRLRQAIDRSGLPHITVVAGDAKATNLPAGRCQGVFMKDVYHHFEYPAEMNASIAGALAPAGRVAIVEFTPPPGSEHRPLVPGDRGKDGMHGITLETLLREVRDTGYTVVSTNQQGRDFKVVLTRPSRNPHPPGTLRRVDAAIGADEWQPAPDR